MSIAFEGRVGSEPFRCTQAYSHLGTGRVTADVLDFRFYVHDVRLVTRDGRETPVTLTQDQKWQYQNVALLDFEDKSGSCANGTVDTNTRVMGTVPAGDYTGLRFRLGVPFSLNHGNAATAPSPLNLSGLFWIWNAGYKFLRVDARVAQNTLLADAGDAGDGGGGEAGAPPVFPVHIGSTGCQGDAKDGGVTDCSRRNVADIELASFDVTKNKVVVDYAALVAGTELTAGGGMGCMSSPEDATCNEIFARLGLDLASGKPAAGQAFFRVE
ncbi:metallo-mystery pair system four-Cys motif protein [Pendulispora rubella]|uniref:Metallo-mystery pair system four-Cys motif protein n=1 Tax=Pendulispora rubella TaxID=2741070 RepID=A0ABZ2KYW9_9BACT